MRNRLRTTARALRVWARELIWRNALVRRIFLLKELFLTRSTRTHYGQFAEDVLIGRLVPDTREGFFVDVGCFHPRRFSNTYALYRRGWRGINVDLDPVKIEGFDMLRRHDFNVCRAVTDEPGEVEYFAPTAYSIVASLHEDHVKGFWHYAKRKVRAATLDEILEQSPFREREIDFLNVDVEGHDQVVLRTLDFARYRPKLIVVESFVPDLEALMKSALFAFLTERGYRLVQWAGNSVFFACATA